MMRYLVAPLVHHEGAQGGSRARQLFLVLGARESRGAEDQLPAADGEVRGAEDHLVTGCEHARLVLGELRAVHVRAKLAPYVRERQAVRAVRDLGVVARDRLVVGHDHVGVFPADTVGAHVAGNGEERRLPRGVVREELPHATPTASLTSQARALSVCGSRAVSAADAESRALRAR
jgi:hypothetical protein